MRILTKLALRELRNHWRFSLFFTLNLASGLVGLVLLSTLLASVRTSLDTRSQSLLGADLSISMRRDLKDEELAAVRKILPPSTQEAVVVDFFSMLETVGADEKTETENRLMQVRAVDGQYPFYGALKLKTSGTRTQASELESSQIAWLDEETAEDFQLKNGSALSIGGMHFQMGDALVEDSTQGMLTLAAAPRVLVAAKWFTKEYLESRGTTIRYSRFYKLPGAADVEKTKKEIEKIIEEPSVRVQTHRESSEGLARLLNYFSDYLALVSLASLSLAALGVVYQFRRYFLSRAKSVAIFLSLGATPARAFGVLAVQLAVLAAAGSLFALILTAIALPVFAKALAPLTVVPIAVQMDTGVALKAVFTGIGLSFLLCLPQLISLRRFNASDLFRENTQFQPGSTSSLWYIPACIAFAALSVLYANSFRLGAFFLVGLAVSAFVFSVIPWNLLKWMEARSKKWSLEARLALLHLRRNPASTLLVSVCLGLVTLLGSLLPQIRASVVEEIEGPTDRPSFFLLDIQPEQLEPLGKLLHASGVDLGQPSALVRGRLIAENGKKSTRREVSSGFKTREDEQESAFRNRGFNLSVRENLSSSETLLQGRPFSGIWDPKSGALPELSVEKRFAERLGWKLGDELTFDVSGEEFSGKIVNIRSVRWTSFQPNFFVVFQKGVLEEVPMVYIGTVPALAKPAARLLARAIPKSFPNVSVIPVDKVLERLYALSEQMMGALLLTTLWVVLASVLTLYSISRYEAFNRLADMNLLKVIGATRRTVRKVFSAESFYLSLACGLMGIAGAAGLSFVLMRWGLEGAWKLDGWALGVAALVTVGWMQAQTWLTAGKVWRARPKDLL